MQSKLYFTLIKRKFNFFFKLIIMYDYLYNSNHFSSKPQSLYGSYRSNFKPLAKKKKKKNLLVTSDFIEKFSPPTQKKETCLRSLVGIALMISGEW